MFRYTMKLYGGCDDDELLSRDFDLNSPLGEEHITRLTSFIINQSAQLSLPYLPDGTITTTEEPIYEAARIVDGKIFIGEL